MFLFLLWVLGATIGSFLNVCIYRLPRGQSIVQPPSHCPRCDTRLQPLDLVPLLSQLFLGARCRYCKGKISWRYFGIELLTGVLFALVGAWAGPFGLDAMGQWQGDWGRLAQGLIFMACLVVIFWVDYDTKLIQLEAVFLLGLTGVAYEAWQYHQGSLTLTTGGLWKDMDWLPAPLPSSLWAMLVTSSGLWLMRDLFSRLYGKEALGFGDVMLVAAIAANLGWSPIIWTFFFLSVVVGASIGVGLQIPRAIYAYRWARRRSQKYFEAMSAAPTEVSANEMVVQTMATEEDSVVAENELLDTPTTEPLPTVSNRQYAQLWQSRAWPLARHAFRKAIPFGPMLAIGAVIALLYGNTINASYLQWIQGSGGANSLQSTLAPSGSAPVSPPLNVPLPPQ